MDDLIRRSDAIKAVEERSFAVRDSYTVKAILRNVPSADRPQGEWIESFKRVEVKQGAYIGAKFVHDGWSCSECSEVVEKRYPNCPYCLARMKGADDENY